jgi:hypothetical protein
MFESRSGEVYSIQHYVIKFVSDLWQIGGFLLVLLFPPNKTDSHDITDLLLKVALSTKKTNEPKPNKNYYISDSFMYMYLFDKVYWKIYG